MKKIITVNSSPFPQDEDLPWEYEEDGFLNWVNEVFVDESDPQITDIEEVIDLLVCANYDVSVSLREN